jgi:phenylalanyl-tRNA synthetase alpha chain
MNSHLSASALEASLAIRDLTDPLQGLHTVGLVVERVQSALDHLWGAPPRLLRASPIVGVADNYDRLGYPPQAAARSPRYARYLDNGRLLRTQMTSAVPSWLDGVGLHAQEDAVLLPGLVWRRDCVDRRHVGEPHQLDVWRVSARCRLARADLLAMVDAVVACVLPGVQWRAHETSHPYTSQGLEVEAMVGGRWMEILECGEAAGHLLLGSGLEPSAWSGLAMGIGLDRMVMIAKGLDDIRLLRAADPRIARQMLDLSPWRPVSSHQASTRDLSVARDPGLDDEMLGDIVRDALGEDAGLVEEASVVSRWAAHELPQAACIRLGLDDGQENLLVRVVVRALDGPLPKARTAAIYDRVYAALHQGSASGYAVLQAPASAAARHGLEHTSRP